MDSVSSPHLHIWKIAYRNEWNFSRMIFLREHCHSLGIFPVKKKMIISAVLVRLANEPPAGGYLGP